MTLGRLDADEKAKFNLGNSGERGNPNVDNALARLDADEKTTTHSTDGTSPRGEGGSP